MSSSNSSEDESDKLLAAVDPDFQIKNGNLSNLEENGVAVKSNRPLLRNNPKFGYKNRPLYSLEVTPESQKFVAKHLSSVLDKQIKEKHSKKVGKLKKRNEEYGIYLFSTSTHQICKKDLEELPQKKQKKKEIKRRKVESSGSEDEDERLKSVVVSSDWVLNSNTT